MGIGSTAPASLLDVNGVINSASGYRYANTNQTAGTYLRSNGTNFVPSAILAADIPASSGNYIQNQNAAAQTTSNFWISGNGMFSGATPLQFTSFGSGTYNQTVVYHNTTSGSGGLYIDLARATDAIGATPIDFHIDARGGGNNFLVVKGNSGNTGIGTNIPGAKLEVIHNGASTYGTAVMINQNVIGNSDGPKLQFHKTMTTSKDWSIGMYNGVDVGTFAISEDGGTLGFGTARMSIIAGGNVGIGTTAPGAKLHISNGDASYALFGPNTTWSSYLYVGAGGSAIAAGKAQVISTNGNLHLDAGVGQNIYIANYNGSNTFMQTGGGNVGIGNTGPGHQLTVGAATSDAQAVTIRGYSNSPASWKGGGAFGYTSASVIMGELSGVAQLGGHSATLNAWANLAINSAGGNVGIGTTGPVDKLDVRDAMSVNEIKFRNVGGGDDSDPYRLRKYRTSSNVNELRLDLNDDSDERFTIYGNSCVGSGCGEYSTNLYHWFRSDGYAYHNGRLGVGNQAPNARLDISDNGGSDGIAMGQIHGDNTSTIQTYIDGQWSNRASYAGGCCNKLLLQPDIGEVGIGLTNPSYKLHVVGNVGVNGTIYPGATSTYLNANEFNHPNGRILLSGNLHIDSYNGNSIYENYYTANNIYQVVGGGRVGVSTTSPAAQFHVWGNATTAAIISSGGSYYTDWPSGWGGALSSWDLCIASIRYSGTQTRSDIRLKKDVTTMSETLSAVETLNKLRPVTYHWIDERLPKNLRYGFIAQEIEKVLPELVDVGTDTMKTLAVNYEDIIPILTLAIQEQQKEIETLKAGNTSSSENAALKNEIAELRKMLLELQQDKK